MSLPISFEEFKKNPIAAVAFCMLLIVGYLYYDSENTKKAIIAKCEGENVKMGDRLHKMERQQKQSDSLLAVYSYEIKFYLNAIEGYSESIQEKK
jgi:hypothetical protein